MKVARTSVAVTLSGGQDVAVAEQLQTYIREAEDGVRRIAIAGAYCEWIVQQLPHGKLGDWLRTYASAVDERTVRRWREFSRSVFEASKRTHVSAITVPQHVLLSANPSELPDDAREARAALDELLAGKTYRQLTFEFKQMEEGADGTLRVKRGRMKGCTQTRTSQGAREQLASEDAMAAEAMREQAAMTASLLKSEAVHRMANRDLLERALEANTEYLTLLRTLIKAAA